MQVTRRNFFGLVGGAILPAPFVLPRLVSAAAGYWGLQVTLNTTAKQIYTLLGSGFPTKPSRTNFQFDPSQFDPLNPYTKEIFIGDFQVSSSRKSYGLYPGGAARYDFVVDLTQLYALGNVTGLLLNIEVFA